MFFKQRSRVYRWGVVASAAVTLVVYNLLWVRTTCEPCFNIIPIEYLDPLSNLDLRLGHWDRSRSFKTFDSAVVGDLYPELSATRHVCLATQSSIESLHEILKIAAHWSGPISVAVYIAGHELSLFQAFITWMLNCQPDIYSRLIFHVVTPADRLAKFGTIPDWSQNCTAAPLYSGQNSTKTDEQRANNIYPQNLLRNVARKNCQTPFVFMVDVDIVPCKGMADSLDKFLSSVGDCERCAFVVPTYELDWRASFPENKTQLMQLVRKKLALPFHKKVFNINQMSSDLNKWEARDGKETSDTQVSHNVTKYRLMYEPFYVAGDTVPPHDERFVGYGFTRNSQVYEMYVIGYEFKVLSPIFTIHWGLQSTNRPKWRVKQQSDNYRKFNIFKKELYAKYNKDPLHFYTDDESNEKKNKTN